MKEYNFTITSLESDMTMVGTLIGIQNKEELNERVEIALGEHFDADAILPKDFSDTIFELSFLEKDFNVEIGDEGNVYKCRIQKTWLY
jgi:hypothetical protein